MSKSIAELNNAKFSKWLEDKQVHIIDSDLIQLTESIHINAKPIIFKENYLNKYREQELITHTIVVKPCQDGYSLVMGYRWLMLAKALNKPVNAVIVGEYMNHYKFMDRVGLIEERDFKCPDDTEMIYPIHKIKIPQYMLKSNFSLLKFAKFGDYFVKNGCVDTAITVKQDRYNKSRVVLKNGYIRYNVLKVNGIKYIPIKFIEE
jgi:hypothetical protein